METGKAAQKAAEQAIRLVNKRITTSYNSMGVISVDVNGRVGAAHNSPNMYWALMTTDQKEPTVSLTAKIVK